MAVRLRLGGVTFQGFEVPEHIQTPGKHQLVVHRLPGGARVIDSMGADPEPITWSGRFRGAQAEQRAKLLELMRDQGTPLQLTWSGYSYTVIISAFTAEFRQKYEIPYSITCEVVQNNSSPLLNIVVGVALAVISDLNSVIGFGNSLGVDSISTAVSSLSTTVNAATAQFNLAAAPAGTVAAMQTAIGNVETPVLSEIAKNNAILAPVAGLAGLTSGADPAKSAAGLVAAAQASVNMGKLLPMQSTLQRMASNVGNLGI